MAQRETGRMESREMCGPKDHILIALSGKLLYNSSIFDAGLLVFVLDS